MKAGRSVEDIYKSFNSNIESLSYFFEKFGVLAIGEDKSLLKDVSDTMKEILKRAGVDIDKIVEENEDKGSSTEEVEEKDLNVAVKDVPKYEVVLGLDDAAIIRNLVRRQSKLQANNFDILSKGSFLMLNNYFEFLLSDLLNYFYSSFQSSLGESEFKLSLKELNEYESIGELTNYLVQKEVEAILLRETFDGLLIYFEKKLSVNLERELIDWNAITEYRERRHIIVHNSSIVNKKYVGRSNNPYGLKIGAEVDIDKDYFLESLQKFYLAGLVLIFQCWGKWDKGNIDKAIETMMTSTFDLLKEGKYNTVKGIGSYCEQISSKNENQEDCLLKIRINKCIALKKQGDQKQLRKELLKIKVGTATPMFKIAFQILNDSDEGLIENFKKAKMLEEINMHTYLSWPIFSFIRENERLNNEILEIFKDT